MNSKETIAAAPLAPPALPSTQPPMKVLLVDDHLMIREGIRVLLAGVPNIEIVGQASDGLEALQKARELRPDLVFMDISMPRMNGIEATRALRRELPKIKVIILTVHESKEYIFEVIRSGARGYMLKDSSPEDMARAIQAMRSDHGFFSPQFSELVSENPIGRPPAGASLGLSAREKEILVLIARGLHNKEIAAQLQISARTVMTYRERICRKLRVKTGPELATIAQASGLLPPGTVVR